MREATVLWFGRQGQHRMVQPACQDRASWDTCLKPLINQLLQYSQESPCGIFIIYTSHNLCYSWKAIIIICDYRLFYIVNLSFKLLNLSGLDTTCRENAASLEVSRGVGAGAPPLSGKEYLVLSSHTLFGNVLLQEHVRHVNPEHPAKAIFSLLCRISWRACVKVNMSML